MSPGKINFIYLLAIRGGFKNRICDLLKLMQLSRDFFVSDLRDKVLALPLMGTTYDGLRRSYSLLVARVYQCFTARLVHRGRGVDMLAYAGLQRRNPFVGNLPSWVPDWAAQSRNVASKATSTIRNQPYRASDSSVPIVRLIGDVFGGEGLSVEGCLVGKICCPSEGHKMGSVHGQVEHFLE